MIKLTEPAVALLAAAFLACAALSQSQQKPVAKSPSFEKTVVPLLAKNCYACHSGANAMAGVRLDNIKTKAAMIQDREKWDKVAHVISSGIMPPKGRPAIPPAERRSVGNWITSTLSAECDVANPGRVTMRRLNRLEYNNTVRDLVGLDLKLADDFPSDDVGYGFDNIGDVLSISPLLMEKYLNAAEIIANKTIAVPVAKPLRYDAGTLQVTGSTGAGPDGEVLMFSAGEAFFDQQYDIPGSHKVRVGAYGQQAGPEATKLELRLDGKPLHLFEVKAKRDKPQVYEHTFDLNPGKHRISVAFTNDFYQPGPPQVDRNLFVQFVEVIRPTGMPATLPASHKKIITEPATKATREKVARKILGKFVSKAFRRPAEPTEVDRLVQIAGLAWKAGESYEQGIRLGVQATLSSPHFLFRVERENGSNKLGGYELASRLSYFIWSSMPDDQLLQLAASGELQKPAVLEAQAKRMLKSPKSKALGESFASQWLNLRKLSIVNPDPAMFPDFNDKMRQSMLTETRMFFDAVVAEDRKITDFVEGKFTFVDGRLAKLYGLPAMSGEGFQKVSLEGTPRAGLLTQAAVLTLTSNPTRTSPVKRGKWVLEQILNQPPPPPPPGVPDLNDDHNAAEAKTIREKMARHLKDPVCASCHTRMDPIGLSLENFDAMGRYRTSDAAGVIDASGELPDGSKFNGANELRSLLMKRRSVFAMALSEKVLTFATGRGIESSDKCFVEEVAKRVEKDGFRFSSLICGVVASDPFRLRKPVPVKKK